MNCFKIVIPNFKKKYYTPGSITLYKQWIVFIQSISIQYVYVIPRFDNATFQMFFCPDVVFECRILHILAPKNQHDFETQTDVRYTSSILKNLLRLPFLSTMTALFFTIPTFNALNSKIPYIQVKSMWQHRRQVKLYSFLKMSQSKHEKQLLPIKTGKAAWNMFAYSSTSVIAIISIHQINQTLVWTFEAQDI